MADPSEVILAAYFTGTDELYGVERKEDFSYIEILHQSVEQNSVNLVILHNNLTHEFVDVHTTERISFYKVDLSHYSYWPHDCRFLEKLKYLEANKQIERVFLVDAKDVRVNMDPFTLIAEYGEHKILVGSEGKWYRNFYRRNISAILSSYAAKNHGRMGVFSDNQVFKRGVLNCGIIGGGRRIMLRFLKRFKSLLAEVYSCTSEPYDSFLVNYILATSEAQAVCLPKNLYFNPFTWNGKPSAFITYFDHYFGVRDITPSPYEKVARLRTQWWSQRSNGADS